MGATGRAHQSSVDGGSVNIEGPGDLSAPWASFADLAVGDRLVEIGTGPARWGFDVAEGLEIDLAESYSYRNGTLHLGEKTTTDPVTQLSGTYRLAVWVVNGFSMKTHGYRDTESLIAFLENFELQDRVDGLVLKPRQRSTISYLRSQTRAPSYLQNVPGVGLIEVKQLTPEKRKAAPPWSGAAAKGGSLYVEDKDSSDWTLLLVGESAITRLYPNYWQAPPEEIVDRFSDTVVTWQ